MLVDYYLGPLFAKAQTSEMFSARAFGQFIPPCNFYKDCTVFREGIPPVRIMGAHRRPPENPLASQINNLQRGL